MPAAAFIVPAVTSIVGSAISGHAASSAASQEKQAGLAAAQSFSPYVQGGNQAFQQLAAKYGINVNGAGTMPQPSTPLPPAPQARSVYPVSNQPVPDYDQPVPPKMMADYGLPLDGPTSRSSY